MRYRLYKPVVFNLEPRPQRDREPFWSGRE